MMIESENRLKNTGTDFVVIPCNSVHYFLPIICEQTTAKFIIIIDETSKSFISIGAKKVCMITYNVTVNAEPYKKRLNCKSITVLQVSVDQQKQVMDIMEDTKHNRVNETTQLRLHGLIISLEDRDADTIILCCT